MQLQSLYEKLGGESAVKELVEKLYIRILQDPLLSPFFSYESIERIKQHQAAFLTMAFGGPSAYEGRPLKTAHASLNLTNQHFNILVRHFEGVMRELNVDKKLISQALSQVETTRTEVVVQHY